MFTMTTSTKSKKKFQPLTVDQCFAKVKSALEQRHESFMDAARYMKSAFVQFTEVDGRDKSYFWTEARKKTGLTKARCEGFIAAHDNFSGLSPEHGSHIDDAAYHYARLVSPAVIKRMIRKARCGNPVGITDVRFWHKRDRGEPIHQTGFTLVCTMPNGKEIRFSHSTNEKITAAQLERQMEKSVWEVTQNVIGRRAA
jgi:hypothetical protein